MSEAEKKAELNGKYKTKGAQQLTLAEYEAQKIKKAKRFKIHVPMFVKIILGTPFGLLFILGLIFIPYILYLIIVSPSAPPPQDEPTETTNR